MEETQTRPRFHPGLIVSAVVAAVVAVAVIVQLSHKAPPEGRAEATAPAEPDQARPIPAFPWHSELAGSDGGAEASGLSFASDAAIGQSASDIDAATAVLAGAQSSAPGADAMHTMRIDGASLDAMVASINGITASLPEDDARAFQKAVRILMVASLPISQLRAQKVAIDKVPPEQLIGGAQRVLAGRTPLEVLQMAQARINAELAKRANGQVGGAPAEWPPAQ